MNKLLKKVLWAAKHSFKPEWREAFNGKTAELFPAKLDNEELGTTHAVQVCEALGDCPGAAEFMEVVKAIGMPAVVDACASLDTLFAMRVAERLGAVFTDRDICDLLNARYGVFAKRFSGVFET
jgi:hypothetical protein